MKPPDRFDTEAAWLVSEFDRTGHVRVDVVPNTDGTVSCYHAALLDGEHGDVELQVVRGTHTNCVRAICLGTSEDFDTMPTLRVWLAKTLRARAHTLHKPGWPRDT